MGQEADEIDGRTVADDLMENILNEVTRSITERTNSCFDSFESLKLHTFGSEDILEYGCSRRENNCAKYKEYECQDNANADFHVDDLCYPSLANLPEVCVHSSSVTKSSTQGEGDFQHQAIREAVAFYRLETGEEENLPSGSKDSRTCGGSSFFDENLHNDSEIVDTEYTRTTEEENCTCTVGSKECKNSCASSIISGHSHDELIEDLQRTLNNVSFDSILLSDDEDGSPRELQISTGPCAKDTGDIVSEFDSQVLIKHDDLKPHYCVDVQTFMPQSKKFCHLNNNYFPLESLPSNYSQLVNESYRKYDSIGKDEDEESLLSDASSEEMVIIEGDEIDEIPFDNFCSQENNRQNYFMCSATTSTSCTAGTRYIPVEPSDSKNILAVNAEVEPIRDHRNWEEDVEVQVNVTEPIKLTIADEMEDCDPVKTKKYWTTVGLVTENNVDPKLAAFIGDDTNGIESVPGVTKVKETRLKRHRNQEDEILPFDHVAEQDMNEKLNRIFGHGQTKPPDDHNQHDNVYPLDCSMESEKSGGDDKVNYLNLSEDATRNGKKKSKFVSRLTKSLTNLFRLKKKNPKC